MNQPIQTKDVLEMILALVRFPYPTICRHSVACDLLSLLEEKGRLDASVVEPLSKALIDGSLGDENAEQILARCFSKLSD